MQQSITNLTFWYNLTSIKSQKISPITILNISECDKTALLMATSIKQITDLGRTSRVDSLSREKSWNYNLSILTRKQGRPETATLREGETNIEQKRLFKSSTSKRNFSVGVQQNITELR